MDLFKTVVVFIVAVAIIALIYTFFIMPSDAPEKAIANTIKFAYENPGYFFSGVATLDKVIGYYDIKNYLSPNQDWVFSYYSLDKGIQLTTLSPVPSVDLYKKISVKPSSEKEYKFSTICYPDFSGFFEGANDYLESKLNCLIIFGLEKDDSDKIKEEVFLYGEYKILQDYNVDLNNMFPKVDGYEGAQFISEVDASSYSGLYLNPDFFKNLVFFESGNQISFNLNNVGNYSTLYVYSCPTIFEKIKEINNKLIESFPICNMYFKAEKMKFNPNTEGMAKGCKALEPRLNENEYNYSQEVCIKKFSCSGCAAPSMCAEAWKQKTGTEYISYTQEVALTNESMDYDSCVGGTSVVGDNVNDTTNNDVNTNNTTTNSSISDVDYSFLNKVTRWGGKRKGYKFIVIHDGGTWGTSDSSAAVTNVINMWNKGNASTHYYITCEGKIYALLDPENVAWHAGCNDGYIGNVNAYSIGIDLRNCEKSSPTHYTLLQMGSLKKLVSDLSAKYGITLSDKSLIGHFEVGCHDDPYTDFSWTSLPGITVNHRTSSYYYNKGSQEASAWVAQMFS